jgi:hypothetical protein
MKKLVLMVAIAVTIALTTVTADAGISDKQLAQQWADNNCPGAYVEKVVTVSKGGTKGKVKGTNYSVRYPKKVKKGKKVNVYFVEVDGDIVAMVCLGKVK